MPRARRFAPALRRARLFTGTLALAVGLMAGAVGAPQTSPARTPAPQPTTAKSTSTKPTHPATLEAKPGEVRGRVLGASQPVADATVAAIPFETGFDQALREARALPEPAALAETRSDAEGLFRLDTRALTAPKGLRLKISAPGHVTTLLEVLIDAQAGAEIEQVRLRPAKAVAGKVVDARGGPVLGARVTLRHRPEGALESSTTTGAGGTFRFEAAPENGGSLHVEAAGFAVRDVGIDQAGALARALALQAERLLEGRVLGVDGRTPAAGALVRAESTTGTTRWVEADRNGGFHLEGVPAGRSNVKAWAADGSQASAPTPDGVGAALTLTLVPAASLRGRVVDAASATPLAGQRVLLRGPAGSFGARSGRDGRYELVGLPAQRYALVVDDAAYVRFERSNLTLTPGAAFNQDVALERAATLSGRVLDEQGVPVAGALARLRSAGATRSPWRAAGVDETTRSGVDGRLRLTRVRPGARRIVQVEHPDFTSSVVSGLTLTAGARTPEITIVLRRGLVLRGRVKDVGGRPVVGAAIEAWADDSITRLGRGGGVLHIAGASNEDGRHTETGADGRFELRGLAPGALTLAVSAAGLARTQREGLDPASVREPIEFTLAPGATLAGFVRDKRGRGQRGLMVEARPAGSVDALPFASGNRFPALERTGEDGAFVIDGLSAGATYDVQPFGARGSARLAGVVAPADGVELIVEGAGRIGGRVLDAATGQAVTDFEVSYRFAEGAGGPGRMILRLGSNDGPGRPKQVHADDGRFTLENVPPGKWRVQAVAKGYPSTSADVTLDDGGEVEDVELRLARGLRLRGRVLDALTGRPILDATVQATAQGGDPRAALLSRITGAGAGTQVNSDADGRFVLEGLTSDTYLITGRHPDWTEATQTARLSADVDAEVELRLAKGAALGGLVLSGGQPVSGAEVTLTPEGGDPLRFPGFQSDENNDVTDASGRFRFERLAPGRYSVQAESHGLSSAAVAVALLQGQARDDVQLSLAGGATLRGRVTGLSEAQLAGVQVTVQGPEDFFANARTNAAGQFEVPGVPSGPLDLRARLGDFAHGTRTARAQVVVAPDQPVVEVEIAFQQGFVLEGHVRRNGQPVPDVLVLAFPKGSAGRDSSDTTDAQGAFRLEGLAAGAYDVQATSLGSGVAALRALTLTGDAALEIDLPTGRLSGVVVDAEGGQPLADARLSVQTGTNPRGGGATTDGSGRFELEGLEDGPQNLTVTRRSYETETRQVSPSEAEVRIELRRGEGVALIARDATYGTPLRGLLVRVQEPSGATAFSGPVTLDSEGRGEIAALRPGRYSLRTAASGYALVVLPTLSVPGPAVTIALTPGGRLELHCGPDTLARPNAAARLLGADGQPYPLSVFASDAAWPLLHPISQLDNLAPGRYTVVLDNGTSKSVAITEGQTAVVELP